MFVFVRDYSGCFFGSHASGWAHSETSLRQSRSAIILVEHKVGTRLVGKGCVKWEVNSFESFTKKGVLKIFFQVISKYPQDYISFRSGSLHDILYKYI